MSILFGIHKTLKKTRYYAVSLIAFIVFVFLKIISKRRKIVFCRMCAERVGHLCANTELFLRRLQMGYFPKENLYVGVCTTPPANKQLLKMYKRVFPVIESNLMFALIVKPIIEKSEYYYELPLDGNEHNEFNQPKPLLYFTEEEEKRGKTMLAEMGIGENDWFMCFHSRDSKYLEHKSGTKREYHDYRDSNIGNYMKAAEYIANQGGYSIRMGSVVNEPLSRNRHKHIIDYAVECRSDFMDIYLLFHCKFLLGSSTGLSCVSQVFGVPIAGVNFVPLDTTPMRKGDLFIPKKLWDINKKRFMSYKEIFNSPVCSYLESEKYKKVGIEVFENSSDEISELAKEMNMRLDGSYKSAIEDEYLQKRFRSLYQPHHACYHSPARIGECFLRKNKDLLADAN